MRVLILSADGFEDSELLCPMYRLKEAGYQNNLSDIPAFMGEVMRVLA